MSAADKLILDNLGSLLKKAASAGSDITLLHEGAFSLVYSGKYAWPVMGFDIHEGHILENGPGLLASTINETAFSGAILCTDDKAVFQVMKPAGFFPADSWTGMITKIVPGTETVNGGDVNVVVEQVYAETDIRQFANIVSAALFRGNELDWQLFGELQKSGTTYLLAARINNILTGTTLLYVDEQKIAGLYMVCVDGQMQQKGIGRKLVTAALQLAQTLGCTQAVLQATKAGVKLYTNMGFEPAGRYYLYYKVK